MPKEQYLQARGDRYPSRRGGEEVPRSIAHVEENLDACATTEEGKAREYTTTTQKAPAEVRTSEPSNSTHVKTKRRESHIITQPRRKQGYGQTRCVSGVVPTNNPTTVVRVRSHRNRQAAKMCSHVTGQQVNRVSANSTTSAEAKEDKRE